VRSSHQFDEDIGAASSENGLFLAKMEFSVMTGPDGRQGTPFGGQYLEIVPNRKLVYDVRFESEPAFGLKTRGEKMIVTVTYDEKDGKTTVTIRTVFNTIAMKNEHLGHGYDEGVGSGCDQLADLVSEMLARRR
jgi:uncharacterized protein YndB with AHSA1/START domain